MSFTALRGLLAERFACWSMVGWESLDAFLERSQFLRQAFVVGQACPEFSNAFAWYALAQVGVTLSGEPLFCPAVAESIVAVFQGTAGQENTIHVMAGDEKIDEGGWQHANTLQLHCSNSGSVESRQVGAILAAEDDDACLSGQFGGCRKDVITQGLHALIRQVDAWNQFGGASEGGGRRAGAHADTAAGAQLTIDHGLL